MSTSGALRTFVLPALIGVGIALAMLIIANWTDGTSVCPHRPLLEVSSPPGGHQATLIKENCGGATGGYIYSVVLTSAGESDRMTRVFPRTSNRNRITDIRWLDDHRVRISHMDRSLPKRRLKDVGAVTVEIEYVGPGSGS